MSLAMTALAHSDEPLVQIAERVGYLSDTAFSITFKRTTGVSPGRYHASRQCSYGVSDIFAANPSLIGKPGPVRAGRHIVDGSNRARLTL